MFARLLLCTVFFLATAAGAVPAFSTTFLPTNTFAYSINQSGHVAGEADFPSGVRHAALWTSQGGPFDLGSLGELSTAQAIDNSFGYGVNATGEFRPVVFGNGALRDVRPTDAQQILVKACTELGDCRTALLTPVPEPRALVLLLAGLLALGAGRWAAPRTVLFR